MNYYYYKIIAHLSSGWTWPLDLCGIGLEVVIVLSMNISNDLGGEGSTHGFSCSKKLTRTLVDVTVLKTRGKKYNYYNTNENKIKITTKFCTRYYARGRSAVAAAESFSTTTTTIIT